jgi:TetR/AcrR family transcriptional regulator, cholesterol catabolism regulator
MEIRTRIIEGAADLFKTHGIRAVTMDTLANHLGISKRTIYEVFSDKDELLSGVLKLMILKQKDLVKRVLDDSENAIVAIFKILEINMNHFQEMSITFQSDIKKFHHEVMMKKSESNEIPDYHSNMQVIERGIKEKLFRKDINPELVNRCIYSLGRAIMDQELYPFEQFSRREVIKNVLINYLRGISTMEGMELINRLEVEF